MENERLAESLSIDPSEIEKFSALAEQWWDPDGKFKPLHRLNPTRLSFIRDRVAAHFGRAPLAPGPLAGLSLLDIGCGGGLLCEPLTRMGATVTGLDASARNIAIARRHAADMDLDIDYHQTSAEDHAARSGQYLDDIPDPRGPPSGAAGRRYDTTPGAGASSAVLVYASAASS